MEIDTEKIYELLTTDDSRGLESIIDKDLQTQIQSQDEWNDLVTILQAACFEIYHRHWLKSHHSILSLFRMPELLGVDCTVFKELRSINKPANIRQASDSLFEILVDISRLQFKNGGSTLFFNVELISSTRSAIITADLIQARYRETIHVLNEIDEVLPSLTKEWVDVSRLWRTGNGFRILRARNMGILIHIKEYKEIRDLLAQEMKVNSEEISGESRRLRREGNSQYLQLSITLDEFVTGLVASRGIRGTFEPHYKTWINHGGLDDF